MLRSNRTIKREEIGTLDLATRVTLEAQITDARSEVVDFAQFARLNTNLAEYAAQCPWRTYLFDFLGPMQDKMVLDVACGYSMTPVILALTGATVYAVDVAPKTVATVKRFAEFKGVGERVHTHVGPVEKLPFANEYFDLIFGGAALHHFQLDMAGQELARVLKRGGRGGFQDPLGHNPLLEMVRDYLPYRNKHPVKGTDHPLKVQDIAIFGRHFTTCTHRGFDLFSMTAKGLHLPQASTARRVLHQLDQKLFDWLPYTQRFARFVVTCVTK